MNSFTPVNLARAERITERIRKFYEAGPGKALIQIRNCGSWKTMRQQPLNSYVFPDDMEKHLTNLAECAMTLIGQHERFDDDYIPSTVPWYGIVEHTAFLGGEVTFETDTSFQHTICKSIEDIGSLKLDPGHEWIRLMIGGMRFMRETFGDTIPVRLRGSMGPSDFANAIRGNDVFYDIYDSPEELRELLKFCIRAAEFFNDLQREQATPLFGGFINGSELWMPGKCIGHVAEDLSTLVTPGTYEEFFLEPLKEFIDYADIAYLHTHSLGHKMIPMFAKIPKIKAMEITNDPNCMRSVEVFRKYYKELDGIAAVLAPSLEELASLKDLLPETKVIINFSAKDEDEAKRAMEIVEKFR